MARKNIKRQDQWLVNFFVIGDEFATSTVIPEDPVTFLKSIDGENWYHLLEEDGSDILVNLRNVSRIEISLQEPLRLAYLYEN